MRNVVYILLLSFLGYGCTNKNEVEPRVPVESEREAPEHAREAEAREPDLHLDARHQMVEDQVAARGVRDERVLEAMREIPRHEFIPATYRYRAYEDSPAPIGHGQTISQPYIVAVMTELLDVRPGQKVLEIGTGSGYQAAVLAELGVNLYSIEIVCDLASRASETLENLDYENVHVRCGDGYKGWPDEAPFDRIIVTAAPPEIPEALIEQLKRGGKLVVPVGDAYQELKVLEKHEDGDVEVQDVFPVRFVPMVPGDETAGTD